MTTSSNISFRTSVKNYKSYILVNIRRDHISDKRLGRDMIIKLINIERERGR